MKYFLFCFSFLSITGFSQEKNNAWKYFPSKDTNTIQQGKEGVLTDLKLDSLPKKTNPIARGTKTVIADTGILAEDTRYTEYAKAHPQIKGFTILLYSGSGASSRTKAREALVSFQQKFQNGVTHLAWKSPNYEVRLGDYRTKLEAQHDLKIIKSEFPTAFIKTDMIELPPLEKMELKPTEK